MELIRTVIEQHRKDYTVDSLVKDSVFAVIATLILLIIWLGVRKLCKKEIHAVEKTALSASLL